MLVLRSLLFNLLFLGGTAIALVVLGIPLLAAPATWIFAVARVWARCVFWLMRVVLGLRWELRGRTELLRPGALVAAKHQSAWDTIVFYLLAPRPAYVMKKELMAIPIYGWLARRQKHIAVDRKAGGSALRQMQRAAQAALDIGATIVVFPQGTRVAPGDKQPYHPGIAGLYGALGVPVVPVALNSGLFWGRRSFVKTPGTIVVEVLPEIPPGLPRAQLMRELESRIEAATARLEVEAYPRNPQPVHPSEN
jgi:1-acyl-sn-glycerol-3-phosphate acyltransferase